MNIFILDRDMKKSARYHTDKHCVKMILEHCQMLCTALNLNAKLRKQLAIGKVPYKSAHVKHPCTLWVSQGYDNFAWLVAYTHVLHQEYQYRYGREHLSYLTLKNSGIITPSLISYGKTRDILELSAPRAMPDECKVGTVIDSYRLYYQMHKTHLFTWTKRRVPLWLRDT